MKNGHNQRNTLCEKNVKASQPCLGDSNRHNSAMLWNPPAPMRERRRNSEPMLGGVSSQATASGSYMIDAPERSLASKGITKSSTIVSPGIGTKLSLRMA